ncbi:MAG: hypothetical protein K2X27_00980 [Candidatus Obscuribacterales bacterium]|nr:hypothetical protein [Candidatus Obscuribacterales bacterium]
MTGSSHELFVGFENVIGLHNEERRLGLQSVELSPALRLQFEISVGVHRAGFEMSLLKSLAREKIAAGERDQENDEREKKEYLQGFCLKWDSV